MKKFTLENLLADGFRKSHAQMFLNTLEYEKDNNFFEPEFLVWAYEHGFSAHESKILGINEENYRDYLSTYDWHKLCPVNDWERIWVNDKLTLKYMLDGTEFSGLMPKYFYYADKNKGLVALPDNPDKKNSPVTLDDFIELLCNPTGGGRTFACKPNNGTMSVGFFKLAYNENKIELNGKPIFEEDLKIFISGHPNYIYTEYFNPSDVFSKFDYRVPTIRIITLNPGGYDAKIIANYIRFANPTTGEANYHEKMGEGDYHLYSNIDGETGKFAGGVKIFENKVVSIENHPVTNKPLTGILPDFPEFLNTVKKIADRFNLVELMGFDVTHTDKGYKIMEINTHPGGSGMQLFKPLLKNPDILNFVRTKLEKIDNLTDAERKARNNISC